MDARAILRGMRELGESTWKAAVPMYTTTRPLANMAMGAGVGGLYGAYSNDTSVLKGMGMGAVGGLGASVYSHFDKALYGSMRGLGMVDSLRGIGKNMMTDVRADMNWLRGMASSSRNLGATLRSAQPINRIKGMWNHAAGTFNRGYYDVRMM
jgi:hypothetical protein